MTTAKKKGLVATILVIAASIGAVALKTTDASAVDCSKAEIRTQKQLDACTDSCSNNGCRDACNGKANWSKQHGCWID